MLIGFMKYNGDCSEEGSAPCRKECYTCTAPPHDHGLKGEVRDDFLGKQLFDATWMLDNFLNGATVYLLIFTKRDISSR